MLGYVLLLQGGFSLVPSDAATGVLSPASSLSSVTRDRVDVQLIVTEAENCDVDRVEYQKPA